MTARLFGIQEFFVGVIQQVKAKGDVIASPNKTDEIAVFRFNPKAIAFSSHSAQVGAIALAVANKHAFGAVIKFGCRAIAHSNKTDAIAFFRLIRKAIAFPSHSTQVKAIALAVVDEHAFGAVIKFSCGAIAHSSKTDAIAFFRFSYKAIASPSYFEETSLRLS
jgi:hypothetical protein